MPPFPPVTRAAATVPPLRRLRPHVQADRRYDRWGSYSLLLLVIVIGYTFLTASARYTTTGWEIYNSPAMFLLENCAVLGGVILAACLGLVATLVRSSLERMLGSIGVVIAAYCLFVMFADSALLLQVASWRQDLLATVLGAPASWVHQRTGQNELLTTAIIVAPWLAAWLLVRGRVLHWFRERIDGQRAVRR